MVVDEKQFQAQIQQTVQMMVQTSDGLANDGLIFASGVMSQGIQVIKSLYTKLYPPAPAAAPEAPSPDATTAPADEVPAEPAAS